MFWAPSTRNTPINLSEFSGGPTKMFKTGAFALQGEAEETWLTWAGEENTLAGPNSILPGNIIGTEPGFSQWCMVRDKLKQTFYERRSFFTSRTLKQWNSWPREAVWSPYWFTRPGWIKSSVTWSGLIADWGGENREHLSPLSIWIILWWQVIILKMIV